MADKFQNKYRIPSARAVWHDYNGGDYFVTICTGGREHYFGEILDGEMVLNGLGTKLDELIAGIPTHHPYAKTPVYQIMPNHVHLIFCIDGTNAACRDAACHVSKTPEHTGVDNSNAACHVSTTPERTDVDNANAACHVSTRNRKMQEIANKCGLLSIAVGGMKSALTKYAKTHNIEFGWQTRFHDHIIRDREEWERIAHYIENNPATWENDKFYTK